MSRILGRAAVVLVLFAALCFTLAVRIQPDPTLGNDPGDAWSLLGLWAAGLAALAASIAFITRRA
jgi:hypothetical protein